eukprot:CAMPEP_0170567860 /NCGR_PEP_ID=MMETSP0211-20121228/80754_1 /TAXON_ID=311385 /ORGANISM="Pseudokeronopsis sp., Strain OXSARD2" /LENGTH=58 /DNA_ID=CAMNT_0010889447 /DNA_START=2180 /DNA_END=2356 /DNA_ORIENTATION=-
MGEMKAYIDKQIKERKELVINSQELRMRNAELEEKERMMTIQNEIQIKKLHKQKQKNG